MADPRNPVDQLLDLLFYAPVGLAVTAAEELPKLIELGRQRLESQVTTARFVGKFAVGQSQKDLEKLAAQFVETLVGLGIIPGHDPTASAPASPPAPPSAPPPPPERPARPKPASAAGPADDGDLAIPGYGALSASQVVQRLAGLSPSQLEAVRRYEAAGRGRKTILSRIAQLQAG
ncbi:MAG TPA: hypothetical protein VM030_00660 [Acidimicrobiales bacterium]|nr:hypothetical protein [Acidimicrobiales bacterium]